MSCRLGHACHTGHSRETPNLVAVCLRRVVSSNSAKRISVAIKAELWYFGLLGDQTKTNCGLDFSLDFSQFRLLCNTLIALPR
jgi:hypothetical protein